MVAAMNWFDWLLRLRAGQDIARWPDAREALEEVRRMVWPGLMEYDEVVGEANALLQEVNPLFDEWRVLGLVNLVWDERRAQARKWDAVTDADRLALAFEDLAARGILTRTAFTCCQTCGFAEIEDERQADEHGFAFFHSQDAERLAEEPAALHLSYGSFEEGTEEAVAKVGRAVADALARQGLTVAWDGTAAQRVAVVNLYYRRRLPRRPRAQRPPLPAQEA